MGDVVFTPAEWLLRHALANSFFNSYGMAVCNLHSFLSGSDNIIHRKEARYWLKLAAQKGDKESKDWLQAHPTLDSEAGPIGFRDLGPTVSVIDGNGLF